MKNSFQVILWCKYFSDIKPEKDNKKRNKIEKEKRGKYMLDKYLSWTLIQ